MAYITRSSSFRRRENKCHRGRSIITGSAGRSPSRVVVHIRGLEAFSDGLGMGSSDFDDSCRCSWLHPTTGVIASKTRRPTFTCCSWLRWQRGEGRKWAVEIEVGSAMSTRAPGIHGAIAPVSLLRLNINPDLVVTISMQITAWQTSPTQIMKESNWMSQRRQSSAARQMTCLESSRSSFLTMSMRV
ncbi:hypothetical protein ACFX10_009456 [Malus domestica]